MKIKILTDTSCGLSYKEAEKLGYEMLPLPFVLDNVEYDDYNIDKAEFYEKLMKCQNVHTSMASIESVMKKFDELLLENDYVLYLPISSGLSSGYASMLTIIDSEEKYKDRVIPIDHKTISVLQRAMLEDVTKMIESGVEPKKIKEIVEDNAKNNRIYISVESLEYLKKGGRLNPLVAAIGNLLSIKPILFSDGGQFDVIRKTRSVKMAEDEIRDLIDKDIKEFFGNIDIEKFSIGIAHTNNEKEAEEYGERMVEHFGTKMNLDELPMIVGCHIGPGSIAMGLYKRVNEY